MLEKIAARLPVSTKVSMAAKVVGLSSDEQSALDNVVRDLSSNTFVSALLGTELNTVADAVEFVTSNELNIGEYSPQFSKAISLLQLPKVRMGVAQYVMKMLKASKHAPLLLSSLQKISEAPIEGFGDVEHSSPEHFISEGMLPFLAEKFSAQDEPQLVQTVHKCPFCNEVFATKE